MWGGHNDGDQQGHVSARMETSLPMGTTSISVSQQQAPTKFAPVVAPKPKFNPYKQPGDATHEGAGKTYSLDFFIISICTYLHMTVVRTHVQVCKMCFST